MVFSFFSCVTWLLFPNVAFIKHFFMRPIIFVAAGRIQAPERKFAPALCRF
jgi:hypothetical protein